MRRFKIRFNGTEFIANEDALVEIINLASIKDEFYVVNEWIDPDAVFDTFTEWKFEDIQPLAVIVNGKIELKSQTDKLQEYMWENIIDESVNYYMDIMSVDLNVERTLKNRKEIVSKMITKYKIERR